jgi:GT2 family glycosyltransferase
MKKLLNSLYAFGRRVLPIEWRRAIRRRMAVEKVFQVEKPEFESPELFETLEEEHPGRPDLLFLPDTEVLQAAVAAALAARGARCFVAGTIAGQRGQTESRVHRFEVPAREREDPAAWERRIEQLVEDFALREAFLVVGSGRWHSLAARLRERHGWKVLWADRGPAPSVEAPDLRLTEGMLRDPAVLLREAAALFPRVSVIVVTFNNREWNRACLASLRRYTEWPNLEIVVVDNGSTDGSADWLKEELKRDVEAFRLVANPENLGFGPAVNQGLAAARGEFLCLLNNDTLVTRGWLSSLLAHLRRDPRVGLVGPSTNEIMNEAKVPVAYTNLAQLPAWARLFTSHHRGEVFPLPMLAMFCVLMRRSLYDEVGPLDERFSIGMFEDDDYCYRVRLAGYEILCARDAFVHHRGRGSFEKLGEERYLDIFRENEQRYLDKWNLSSRPARNREELPERLAKEEGVVVFLPSIGWDITLIQRPHYLAKTLARAGRTVIYDCTVRDSQDDCFVGFRQVEPNVFLYRGPARTLQPLRRPWLWAYPYNVPEPGAWPGARLAYDIIDDLGVFPYPEKEMRRKHQYALREARCVFAVSAPLLDEARKIRPDAIYLPNGVDTSRFQNVDLSLAPPELRRLRAEGHRIAGYVGSLSKWRDLSLLERVAPLCPGWHFVLIGVSLDQAYERSGLKEIANVHFLGPVSHAAIPAALALFDVALEPFTATRMMSASSPLKLYEYFAAGTPIVSTPLPEMTAFPEVLVVREAGEWKSALSEALERAGDAAFVGRLRERARENEWTARGAEILKHLV